MHLPAEAGVQAQVQMSLGIGLPHKLRWLLLGLRNLTSARRSSSFTLACSASYHRSIARSVQQVVAY
jgi:predicted RNase H-like nuclease